MAIRKQTGVNESDNVISDMDDADNSIDDVASMLEEAQDHIENKDETKALSCIESALADLVAVRDYLRDKE